MIGWKIHCEYLSLLRFSCKICFKIIIVWRVLTNKRMQRLFFLNTNYDWTFICIFSKMTCPGCKFCLNFPQTFENNNNNNIPQSLNSRSNLNTAFLKYQIYLCMCTSQSLYFCFRRVIENSWFANKNTGKAKFEKN